MTSGREFWAGKKPDRDFWEDRKPTKGWYSGVHRTLYPRQCEQCGSEYLRPRHQTSRFCSEQCHNEYQSRNKVEVLCAQCGTRFKKRAALINKTKSGLSFCSRLCKDQAQRLGGLKEIQPPHYGTGLNRERLIEQRGHRCEGDNCGVVEWKGQPVPLEVDHIDGNYMNNDDRNLRLLCRNCHAQTPTFGSRNLGKGRRSRRKQKLAGQVPA